MTTLRRMDEDQSHMTEMILDLTVKIIFLLTGEHYKVVRNTHDDCPQEKIKGPPTHCLTAKRKYKIVEAVNRILELLTGEVPIRCQDVTVYFSMEEWEYLEGHKDLYKDVMMEDEPDLSKKRNPPQRCPRPLEDLAIPPYDQVEDLIDVKVHVKAAEEETLVRGDHSIKEGNMMELLKEESTDGSKKRNPPQRSPRPLEDLPIPCQDQVDEAEGHKDLYRNIMMEPPNDRNPPQRCAHPLEDLPILHHDLNENLSSRNIVIKQDVIMSDGEYGVMKELNEGLEEQSKNPTKETPRKKNPPQRCPHRQDYTQVDLPIPHHDQNEILGGRNIVIKQEVIMSDEEYGVMKELNKVYEEQSKDPTKETPRKRNPPERCPYPQDSTQEDLTIPHHDQREEPYFMRIEVKEEEKEEVSPMMLYQESMVGMVATIKQEEPSTVLSTDGSRKRNPPQRCPHPRDSQDSSHLPIPRHDQDGDLEHIKVVVKEEEETSVSGARQSMEEEEMMVKSEEEESSLHVDTNGHYAWSVMEEPLMSCTDVSAGSPGIIKNDPRLDTVNQNIQRPPFLIHRSVDLSNPEESADILHVVIPDSSTSPSIPNESHGKGVDGAENPFCCTVCGKTFADKKALQKHQRIHVGKPLFSCPECEKRFTRKHYLQKHRRIHTGERPFSCSECGKCFIRKAGLQDHQRIHTGERPFLCTECGKRFTTKQHLQKHIRIHTGERPFSCSECGKCFIQKEALKDHQRIHTGERPFLCTECGKRFGLKGSLRKHQRLHAGERPFRCSECGKGFIKREILLIHQRLHTGERPFSCSECGKGFNERGKLLVHQRIHTGERPFSCSLCGKSFIENGKLLAHQRVHRARDPFSCLDCGKSFRKTTELLIHQRIHRFECPYSCSMCGKGFKEIEAFLEHHRIHPPMAQLSCS